MKQPILIPVPELGLYRLVEDWLIPHTNIKVPAEFLYNGASIPGIFQSVTYTPFHPDVMAPALGHDWGFLSHYGSMEFINDLFKTHLRDNGVSRDTSRIMWRGVNIGGTFCWENSESESKLLEEMKSKILNRGLTLEEFGLGTFNIGR